MFFVTLFQTPHGTLAMVPILTFGHQPAAGVGVGTGRQTWLAGACDLVETGSGEAWLLCGLASLGGAQRGQEVGRRGAGRQREPPLDGDKSPAAAGWPHRASTTGPIVAPP